MHTITQPAPVRKEAPPLDFDARLALSALEMDFRIDSEPLALLDLADVIRMPVEEPEPATAPSLAPLAAVLHRAHTRILRDGWTTGHCRTSQAKCAYEAIRAEAATADQAAAAAAVLLDTIRRQFPDTATVPAWNDEQRQPGVVLRMLDQAARDAEQQGI